MNREELFSTSAFNSMSRRFPNVDKISVFNNSDLASDLEMISMSFTSHREYNCSRSGGKLISATVNDKSCLLRYIDMTPNVETQADTLVYLSLLKTLRHRCEQHILIIVYSLLVWQQHASFYSFDSFGIYSHLEEMQAVGVVRAGSGRAAETKVVFLAILIPIAISDNAHFSKQKNQVGHCFRSWNWVLLSHKIYSRKNTGGLESTNQNSPRRSEGSWASASEFDRAWVMSTIRTVFLLTIYFE